MISELNVFRFFHSFLALPHDGKNYYYENDYASAKSQSTFQLDTINFDF